MSSPMRKQYKRQKVSADDMSHLGADGVDNKKKSKKEKKNGVRTRSTKSSSESSSNGTTFLDPNSFFAEAQNGTGKKVKWFNF